MVCLCVEWYLSKGALLYSSQYSLHLNDDPIYISIVDIIYHCFVQFEPIDSKTKLNF